MSLWAKWTPPLPPKPAAGEAEQKSAGGGFKPYSPQRAPRTQRMESQKN
jgi:hypothetical protein